MTETPRKDTPLRKMHPHALQQFILGDQTSAAFNQCYKQVEGMRADAHRETGCQQTSFIGLQLEPSKPITNRCGRIRH